MARVAFEGATKRFDGVAAVDHLDLEARDGELLVLLGPSGCGKTTALRLVAGLEEADSGEILIGDQVVNDVEAKDRDVAMVFQSYALYPHLSVRRNIEFPLRLRGVEAAERERRVADVAESLGLTDYLDRKPRQLSGGQRQRVALGRAIVRSPRAFLMDEPLSNLDAALRLQTRADIVSLQHRLGTTTLYVTHDQVEAMTMGHRIAVMDRGVLQQVDSPQVIYDHPANIFVAGFIGTPGMNLLPLLAVHDSAPPGTSATGTGGTSAWGDVPGGTILLGEDAREGGPAGATRHAVGSSLVAGVRPEHLALDAAGTIDATVLIVEVLGAEVHVVCTLADGTKVTVRQDAGAPRPGLGDGVRLGTTAVAVHLFTGERGGRVSSAS
ncbi:MAG: ABC transporter ATP-binding protein [Acidimicrobiales bacterium]